MSKGSGTLFFDIETHEAKKLYSMPPEQFVRLIGYAWGSGEVVITTNLDELREQILKARWVIGHNINDFDLRAVFGVESDIPMMLADEGRVYDTWTHAALVNPAPFRYTNRFGKPARATKPDEAKKWFGLDEQAFQLGVPGKTHSLVDLAVEFGVGSNKEEKKISGFGMIPIDDPRYVEYLIGDVKASRAVAKELLKLGPLNKYALREQRIESRKATISSNGFRVNVAKATKRSEFLRVQREEIMGMLVEKYNFPTTGKKPWVSKEGKLALLKALKDHGIDEGSRPHWPRTDKGGALQLGGKVILQLVEDTDEETQKLGAAIAQLMGQRSLADLALKTMHPDGFTHPEITMLQRSGRWSTTEPGLTVWTSRGPNAVEKEYFDPDVDDDVLLEIDASNADARIVGWCSGDEAFNERFLPGADGHLINAQAAWGKDVVGTNKKDPVTAEYRYKAKALGHGWSYGGGYKTLAREAKLPEKDAKQFCEGMAARYVRVIAWQDAVRRQARATGYVTNWWGRRMPVEKNREYTQAPALMGQSGTRELMCDALLKMPYNVIRRVKAQIHDALVFSVPRSKFEVCRDYLVKLMTVTLPAPPGGVEMHFPMEAGPAGENWYLSDHANLEQAAA
jgi:DNA polymerase-1